MTRTKERHSPEYDWKKACVILFFISFTIAIFLNLVAKENKFTEQQRTEDTVIFFNKSNICQENNCCVVNSLQYNARCDGYCCNVKCKLFDTTSKNLSDVLETIIENDCSSSSIELDIQEIIFENNTMNPTWLYSSNFEVRILTLSSAYLNTILPKSFEGNVFVRLSYLILENLHLSYMEKEVFYGLENLQYLFIYKSTFDNIDDEVSNEISKNLEILQIYESKLKLINLTGKISFEKLYLADLRFNHFDLIDEYTFAGLNNCKSLHISNCDIAEIKEKAFSKMNALELISLNDNKLTHLSQEVFDENVISKINIQLQDNKWICDCKLQWLQNYVIHKLEQVNTYIVPLCDKPQNTSFTELDFCPITESTSETTSRPSIEDVSEGPTTTPHTEVSEKSSTTFHNANNTIMSTQSFPNIIIGCNGLLRMPVFNHILNEYEYENNKTLILLPTTKFYISVNKLHSVQITFTSEDYSGLLWYNIKDSENAITTNTAYCKFNLSNPHIIDDVLPGFFYVFCVYNNFNMISLSPFDCQGFLVPLDKDDLTWLSNYTKEMTIGLFCVYLFGLWLAGGLIIYIIMILNPTMLKGSKNVEIVKSRMSNKSANQTNVQTNVEVPTTSNNNNEREINRRKLMVRSQSEASIASYVSKISYVSAVEPTSKQLISWRQAETKRVTEISIEPPELPPRNK